METETVVLEMEVQSNKVQPQKISILAALFELVMAIIYYIATIIDEITKRYFGIAVVTTLRKKYDFYLSQLNNNYIIPYNKKKQTIIAVAKAYYYFFIAKILGLIESIAPSFAKSVVLKLKVYRSYAEQQVTIFSQTAQNLIDEWKHKGENIVEDLKQKGEKLHKRGEKVVEEFKLKNEGLRKKGETLLNEIQKKKPFLLNQSLSYYS